MAEYCVVAAELARARIYTLESSETPELETSPYLVERKTLANPEHKASEGEVWTDTRRGAHREHQGAQTGTQTTGIPHHNYDEHRENNENQINRSFARDVVTDLKQVIQEKKISHIVLCAETQMLGVLRPELGALPTDQVKLTEVNKDLASLTPHELHKKLADDGLLPPQKRPNVPV